MEIVSWGLFNKYIQPVEDFEGREAFSPCSGNGLPHSRGAFNTPNLLKCSKNNNEMEF